jgi:hypothetical protein
MLNSDLLTQLQALNNSDLRLLPATPEQRQYREERERQYTRDIEEREFRERQALSLEARRSLEKYFTDNNGEIKKMNKVTLHSRKCVMALRSSDSDTGSAEWFIRLWDSMLHIHKKAFETNIELKYSFNPDDFHVSWSMFGQNPIIFYLKSVLEPLVFKYFQSPEIPNPWREAIDLLHNTHNPTKKPQYVDFLREVFDVYGADEETEPARGLSRMPEAPHRHANLHALLELLRNA